MAMKLVPWIRPALLAPFAGMTVVVTTFVLIGGTDPSLGGRLGNWAWGMLLGSLVAALISGVLLAIDIAFLRANLRKPPTGRRAWTSALAMPFLVFAVYTAFRPSDNELGLTFFFSLVFPIVIVAIPVRFLTSEKAEGA